MESGLIATIFLSHILIFESIPGYLNDLHINFFVSGLVFDDDLSSCIAHEGCGDSSLHDFVPPSHLHELDFIISYNIMHVLAHDLFVLDLYLFWFIMKHKGRCFDTILGRFY